MSEPDADAPDSMLGGVRSRSDEPLLALEIPAFVRRGQELEAILQGVDDRCRSNRRKLLDMVHMRLRQWAKLATGPDDWRDAFRASIADLWALTNADAPAWAPFPGTTRRRRAAARDLIASVERFNGRWVEFVDRMDLRLTNEIIEDYNRFYLVEKECAVGSSRLAAMHFKIVPKVTVAKIMVDFPPLPVPEPAG
ncbi:hypothetical protein [Paludisphaera rhizosphaerae]|uniref:hypothetical protein n=1 Tax=Paludisphaera rhizosphaerae TaxID=2711216 RepID=UPI0013EB1D84|nr:hypothetical protein [Paludisphaera rhizosphaerae]